MISFTSGCQTKMVY